MGRYLSLHWRECPAEALIRAKVQEARDHRDARRHAEETARAERRNADEWHRLCLDLTARADSLRQQLAQAEAELQQWGQAVNPWARKPEGAHDKKPLSPLFPAQRTQTPAGAGVTGEAATVPAGHEATA